MSLFENPVVRIENPATIFPVQGVLVHPGDMPGDWHSGTLSHYNMQKNNRTGKWLF